MAIRFYSEDCSFLPKCRGKISAWIKESIVNEGFRAGEIAFVFCSQEYHLDMNRKYLGHDYQTDVITFDYSDLKGDRVVAGDVFIDWNQVALQAEEWKTSRDEELLRVMVHGVLHLCGYGDANEEESSIMRSKEDYYLGRYLDTNTKYPNFKL